MTTWNELKQDERALLTAIYEWGGWINAMQTGGNYDYDVMCALRDKKLIECARSGIVYIMRITPAGLAVWQQGQTPDELARLREQVEALTAERDALVRAGNAVLDEVTVNKRGFISIAIGATVHSWNKSTGMGRALFALREVLIASAKKRAGNPQ